MYLSKMCKNWKKIWVLFWFHETRLQNHSKKNEYKLYDLKIIFNYSKLKKKFQLHIFFYYE